MRSKRLPILGIIIVGFVHSSVAAGGKIYFANSDTGTIFRANLDGSSKESVLSDTNTPANIGGIAVDPVNQRIYWTDSANDIGRLRRANYDGSGIQTLDSAATDRRFYDVEVDVANNRVYWSRGSQVFRANLNGDDAIEITPSDVSRIVGLAIDAANDHLYYVDFRDQHIGRTNLDGGDNSILINLEDQSIDDPYDIDIDLANGKLYFHSEDESDHFRSNLDASDLEFLFNGHLDQNSGEHHPVAVEVDPAAGFMYWTEWDTGQVWRANLLGQNRTMLIDGLGQGAGVALDLVVPEPVSVLLTIPAMILIIGHRTRKRM